MKTLTKPIVCCGFTPCVQRIIEFEKVEKGSVNRARKVSIGIGGKGANVARMVKQLGGEAVLLEFAGGANGLLLEQMLMGEGIDFRHVAVAGETRICQTLLEEGNPEATELVEEMPPVSSDEWSQMLALLESMDLGGAIVPVSGKLPAGAPVEGYAAICRMVADAGGQVILDVQGEPLLNALEYKPSIVKINDAELFQATGIMDLGMACRELLSRGAGAVLITRGSRSAFYFDHDVALEIMPLDIDAINPIGSGDAVTAGLSVALNGGGSILDAVKTGMACGAANAMNLVSGFLKPEDVDRLVKQVTVIDA